jgi:beta-lactamase class A
MRYPPPNAGSQRPHYNANRDNTSRDGFPRSGWEPPRSPRRRYRYPYTTAAAVLLLLAVSAALFGVFGARLRDALPAGLPLLGGPPAHQALDALSPDLAHYVASQGNDMGVALFDMTRNRYYAANENTPFILASSAKVYILAGYLDILETQGRRPSSGDIQTMTQMIEHSDNDAAQLLYERLGYDAGQKRFLDKLGIAYQPNPNGWGWATGTPAGIVKMLTLLQQGQVLNASDRQLALNLLDNVASDQQWGVGDTAPQGAKVYMKDGWVTGPDNLWAQNSSGIVVAGHETYILSVYTQHQPTYDWSKVQHVCQAAAQTMV